MLDFCPSVPGVGWQQALREKIQSHTIKRSWFSLYLFWYQQIVVFTTSNTCKLSNFFNTLGALLAPFHKKESFPCFKKLV